MIVLSLASPFWEDESALALSGEDYTNAAKICIAALEAAGYSLQVRDESTGELRDLEESDLEE